MTQSVLLLPHIKVHNANALSSPFTIGFPSVTAFLGMAHALERKLNDKDIPLAIVGAGIICHEADMQTYKGANDFEHSIVGTRNPLVQDKKDKSAFKSSAFIAEARIHLDISLVLQINNLPYPPQQQDELITRVRHLLNSRLKLAGGDILMYKEKPEIRRIDEDDESLQKLQRKLMPGYALIERRDLMIQSMESGSDALDSLIDYLAINYTCNTDTKTDGAEAKAEWQRQRKAPGWIVPIATGFQGISEPGQATNQRDNDTPHCFAESVVTLGEFKMPYRIKTLEGMLWRYHYDSANNLYLCQQKNSRLDHSEYAYEEF